MRHEAEATTELLEQTQTLAPKWRMVLGLVLGGFATAMFLGDHGTYFTQLPVVLAIVALTLIGSALQPMRRARMPERELQDTLARWDELAAAVAAAEGAGQSPARALQSLGITRFEVRRFVLRRLRGEQEQVEQASTAGESVRTTSAAYLPRRSDPRTDMPTPPWLPPAP